MSQVSGVCAAATFVLKPLVLRYSESLEPVPRANVLATVASLWGGAAANNVCVIASLVTGAALGPACAVTGVLWGMKTWADTAEDREFVRRCSEARARNPNTFCVLKLSPRQAVAAAPAAAQQEAP